MATTVETFANQPSTTVSSGGTTAPASGTPESWTVASSSSFPPASNSASPPTQFHVADTALGMTGEIIAVTNVSGTTWTVTRGAESTATAAHSAGFTIVEVVSAGALGGLLQSANNLSDVQSAPAARTSLGLGSAATISAPVSIANGGTGQVTQQAAMDALAGAQTSGQFLRGNGTHVVMAAIPAADLTGVALLASPNTFTASPQSVGTDTSTGQTQINGGSINLVQNGPTGPGHPFINFFAWVGGASGTNGWQLGVDTANHGGGRDLAISRIVNGAANDIFYFNYATGALGLGAATPPSDSYWLEILSSTSDTKGCLALGVGSGATGNPLAIAASSGVPQVWVDSGFAVNTVAGGPGLKIKGEATNNTCLTLTNNTDTLEYAFQVVPGSNVFVFKAVETNTSIFFGGTDGSLKIINNIGFYNKTPVAQPTAGGVTAGFTAGGGTAMNSASTSTGNTGASAYTFGDVVAALKNVGLIAA